MTNGLVWYSDIIIRYIFRHKINNNIELVSIMLLQIPFNHTDLSLFLETDLTLKRLGGQFDPPWRFSKTVFSMQRAKPYIILTSNFIMRCIFPQSFINVPDVFQTLWRLFSSVLTIFINFSDFLSFPCYKETISI